MSQIHKKKNIETRVSSQNQYIHFNFESDLLLILIEKINHTIIWDFTISTPNERKENNVYRCFDEHVVWSSRH